MCVCLFVCEKVVCTVYAVEPVTNRKGEYFFFMIGHKSLCELCNDRDMLYAVRIKVTENCA